MSITAEELGQQLQNQLLALQDDLANDLKDEFDNAVIDAHALHDLLKYYMQEYLKIADKFHTKHQQLIPDALVLRAALFATPALRCQVWKQLFGIEHKDESLIEEQLHQLRQSQPIDDTQRQQNELITRDVERTRAQDIELLPVYREQIALLLMHYVHSRGVQYKQGLNEIMTPIFLLHARCNNGNPQLGVIFNSFYSLISKFLPSTFNDLEFENLRLNLKLFRLLLLYFDPELGLWLDRHEALPELYLTPWFITLFARDLPLDMVFFLWDVYLVDGDPLMHLYLALALLMARRTVLLQADAASLPIVLRSLSLTCVIELLIRARALRDKTPVNIRQRMFESSFPAESNDKLHSESMSWYESLLPCMRVSPAEIVTQAYSDLTGDTSGLKHIVLDCREKRQFEAGRLPCAVHVDPMRLLDPSTRQALIDEFTSMRGQHLCVVGAEMRSYAVVLGELTSMTADAQASPFDDWLQKRSALPPENAVASSWVPSSYLTPAELQALHRDDQQRKLKNNAQLDRLAGAALPVALPVNNKVKLLQEASTISLPIGLTAPAEEVAIDSISAPSIGLVAPKIESDSTDHFRPQSLSEPMLSWPTTNALMDPFSASLIHCLQSNCFSHVSVCEGGYPACHDLVLKYKQERMALAKADVSSTILITQSIELVDHVPLNCLQCSPLVYERFRGLRSRKLAEKPPLAERDKPKTKETAETAIVASLSLKKWFTAARTDFAELPPSAAVPVDKEPSLFARWGREASSLAKRLSEQINERVDERESAIKRHLDEKRADSSNEAFDLRAMAQDSQLALFQTFEIRRIAQGSKALLVPRVLSVSKQALLWLRIEMKRAPIPHDDQQSAFSLAADEDDIADVELDGVSPSVKEKPSLTNPTQRPFSLILLQPIAHLHAKHSLLSLDKITRSTQRLAVLTFHWKSPLSGDDADQRTSMYIFDRPDECLKVIKTRFAEAKNKASDAVQEHKEDDDDGSGSEEEEDQQEQPASSIHQQDSLP